MTISIPLWLLPFLVLAFGCVVVSYCGESIGVGGLMLLLSVVAALCVAIGMAI